MEWNASQKSFVPVNKGAKRWMRSLRVLWTDFSYRVYYFSIRWWLRKQCSQNAGDSEVFYASFKDLKGCYFHFYPSPHELIPNQDI